MFLHIFVKMVKAKKRKKNGHGIWILGRYLEMFTKKCKSMDFWIKDYHESAFLKEKKKKKRIF